MAESGDKEFSLEYLAERLRLREKISNNNLDENQGNSQNDGRYLDDLIVREEFIIEDVVGHNQLKTITSSERINMGGNVYTYNTGIIPQLNLSVKPFNNIPVRYLIFRGYSPVEVGDHISTLIPRYEINLDNSSQELYCDRPYREREDTIEIIKLDNMSQMKLRSDRSYDYKDYFK